MMDKPEPIKFVDLDDARLENPSKAFFSASIDPKPFLQRVKRAILAYLTRHA